MTSRVRALWHAAAPVRAQMWAHRKRTDWRPAKLIADRLPNEIVYWTVIRAGAHHIRSNEIVPDVPFMTVLQRLERPIRRRDVIWELTEAIRLTQEYVGLPAAEGWSWYDALRRYRPDLTEEYLQSISAPHPTPTTTR